MKAIKKTKISNIPKTSGAVVDSLESNVDKATNAPSIRSVLQKIQEVASNIIHAITADKLKTARKIKLTGAVTGEASFDGSRDVTISTTQDNIAVVEGSQVLKDAPADTLQTHSTTTFRVNLPSGFTHHNCFVISIGTKFLQTDDGFGYGTAAEYDVFAMSNNLIPLRVMLEKEDVILFEAENCYKDVTLRYQVVLMKKNPEIKEKAK